MNIAIVGGGAAGFFAAITCAEANPACEVTLFEKSSRFLTKVRISGGGRCNVTHACFDPRQFSESYPRGRRELIAALHRFSARDTVEWFDSRGVTLKSERDGRMFPITDDSGTVVRALLENAGKVGVQMLTGTAVEGVRRDSESFRLLLASGDTFQCDRLLLATGGCRDQIGATLASSLGHTIEPAVPSLFSLHSNRAALRSLPGVTVDDVELSLRDEKLRERGPLLVTHNGVSGPVVLRFSAWGARILHASNYRFALSVNWLPSWTEESLRNEMELQRRASPNRRISNSPIGAIPARLWEQLVQDAGISATSTWTTLTRANKIALLAVLRATELPITGKSLNKDEFVTCGGVRLSEVDLRTMESRKMPGLFFAGELLDIDGITGGYNFQSAWTTGWLAGRAMALERP